MALVVSCLVFKCLFGPVILQGNGGNAGEERRKSREEERERRSKKSIDAGRRTPHHTHNYCPPHSGITGIHSNIYRIVPRFWPYQRSSSEEETREREGKPSYREVSAADDKQTQSKSDRQY